MPNVFLNSPLKKNATQTAKGEGSFHPLRPHSLELAKRKGKLIYGELVLFHGWSPPCSYVYREWVWRQDLQGAAGDIPTKLRT